MGSLARNGLAKWEAAALAVAGGAGGLALMNRLIAASAGEPHSALSGEYGTYSWSLGDIFYTVKGHGSPVVLIHGIYAGASSYEYRRVFDLLAQQFRVYAFDLLGFGLSSRPPLDYSPVLYEELIEDFIMQVVGGADQPVRVIASSLSAAFTIRAAAERPGIFSRLVLIQPTGFEDLANLNETAGGRFGRAFLRSPLIGQAAYNAIASRASIRYFLTSKTYAHADAVSDDMVDYYYMAAHQPGARFAPASFLTGALNTPVASVYPLLKRPILLCWGKDAKFAPLQHARAFRQANPRAELRVFDCGSLPQDEAAEEFAADVSAWLKASTTSKPRG